MSRRVWFAEKGELRSLIVTYLRADGNVYAVKEGAGTTTAECLAHADAQLRPGTWTRLTVSDPNSIYADVMNDGKRHPPGYRARQKRGEGVTVTVPERTAA